MLQVAFVSMAEIKSNWEWNEEATMKRRLCYLFNFIKNTCLNSCLVPPCKSSFLLLKVLAFLGGGGGGNICFYNISGHQLAKTAVYFSLLAPRNVSPFSSRRNVPRRLWKYILFNFFYADKTRFWQIKRFHKFLCLF